MRDGIRNRSLLKNNVIALAALSSGRKFQLLGLAGLWPYSRLLDAAQTVYFTIYYQLSRVSEELSETARCCSDRVFYNI